MRRRHVSKEEGTDKVVSPPESNGKTKQNGDTGKPKRRTLSVPLLLFCAINIGLLWAAYRYTRESYKVKTSAEIVRQNPPGTCILDADNMPETWRAWGDLSFDSGKPWSPEEQTLANQAVEKGLDELVNFYDNVSDERIRDLAVDGVNSLIDEVYASTNMPEFHQRAKIATSRQIKIAASKYVKSPKYRAGCAYAQQQLQFTAYAHYLSERLPDDTELKSVRDTMVDRLNAMFRACENIDGVLDNEESFRVLLRKKDLDVDTVYGWILMACALIDCMTVPELEMPSDTNDFIAGLWEWLKTYHIPYARDNEDGMGDYVTFDMAYVATHIAYIPTGYGRHSQIREDAPYLYTYMRENFYAALDTGVLDLVSEFVDVLRQYGCTEENDLQVLHGSRYLLHIFKESGNSWINRREEFEEGKEVSDYYLVHKPWTAISGVQRREAEPVVPGSYGYAFRQALKQGVVPQKIATD